MECFEIGDTVKLKSSDVTMTVDNIDLPYDGAITCIWFTTNGEKKISTFTHNELVKVNDNIR